MRYTGPVEPVQPSPQDQIDALLRRVEDLETARDVRVTVTHHHAAPEPAPVWRYQPGGFVLCDCDSGCRDAVPVSGFYRGSLVIRCDSL